MADTTSKKSAKTKKPARATKAKKAASTVAPAVAKSKAPQSKYAVLRKLNFGLAALLVVQAAAIIVLGGAQTVPITTQYLATDTLASEATGHEVLAVAVRHVADLRISTLVVAKFLLIFAAVYLLAATVLRAKYEAWLDRGINKLRWVGFGLGGASMTIAIATLSGVSDLGYLALFAGSIVLAAVCALALELLGRGRRLSRLLAGGAVFGMVLPWLVFIGSLVSVSLFDGSLPSFMYYVYASMFLFYVAVGLATHLRVTQRGQWKDTVYTERMFSVLGFVGASILAWQIFAGAL